MLRLDFQQQSLNLIERSRSVAYGQSLLAEAKLHRLAARTEHRLAWPTANRTFDLLPLTIY
ncbi:MAG: hypothetical protein F6K26_33735 [Moorea sp. SIO2I5]|nr:hypothetical protein [Moorena sp. SIO2I5]